MDLRCRAAHILLWLATAFTVMQITKTQESPLVEISHTGTVTHRVHCTERLICVGRSNRVFWTFLGGGATPVANSTTRRHEIRTTIVNGMEQTQATLLFDPVIPRFPESYVCQILGDNPTALNVRVITNSDAAEVVSRVLGEVDISNMTIGSEPITFACQVDTCLTDPMVQFFKNGNAITTPQSAGSNETITHEIPVEAGTAGVYTCTVNVPSVGFTSPPETLIITGIPMSPPTTTTMTTGTGNTPPTTPPTTQPNPSSPSSTSMMASPTPTAGAKIFSAELSVLLSLLLVTLLALLTTSL